MALGEARSKIEHIAGVPIQPESEQELLHVFLAKGVQATTAIEGNTLSEEQVRQHLQGTLKLPPSQQYLQQEIDNILSAFNRIMDEGLKPGDLQLSSIRIKAFNQLILKDLPLDDEDVVPGEYRRDRRVVGTYRCPPPEACEVLMERFCQWLNGNTFEPSGELDRITIAILRAVVAHLYFVWIHPFGDGNGRTGRLIEFQILVEAGVPQPAAHLLSNFYNQTRNEYYRQLSAASQSGGDVVPFLTYAVTGLVDQLKQQIDWIRDQQMRVAWINYVHERFVDERSSTAVRRRKLVLALTDLSTPVPRAGLRRLTPQLTELYADKTTKTLARDLNYLVLMRLIIREPTGYRAHREIVAAFLPLRRARNGGSRRGRAKRGSQPSDAPAPKAGAVPRVPTA
jgi:Fic family protein